MKNETEVFEGEYEEASDTALTVASRGSDLVLGTQAAHKALEYRAKGLEALRLASIRALSPKDFHRFGDNHWLQASGVSKLVQIYGINFTAPKFTKEWEPIKGEDGEIIERGKFVWRCEVAAYFPMDGNRAVTSTGSASSRDDFFAKNKDGSYKHWLDVDSEDVRKKSETNARARALIEIGIANFTPDELVQAGLDTSKSTGHDYQKSSFDKSEPTEKQMKMLFVLCGKKVQGIEGKDLHKQIEDKKLSRAQVSNLIDWMNKYQDGAMDYEEEFKTKYKDAVVGKLKVASEPVPSGASKEGDDYI